MTRRPRVLIAEDHAGMAKAISRLLSLDCDIVGSVKDGRAVVEDVQRLQPDIIVLDLNLPDISGLAVCRQITRLNLQAKVIVFTAMNDPLIRKRCLEAGAFAFVSKMAGDGDLLSTVRRLCADPS